MLVIDAMLLVDALLVAGHSRGRLASQDLQTPELIDAELLSVLRRLVLSGGLQESHALQALATSSQLGLRRYPSCSVRPCSPLMPASPGHRGCGASWRWRGLEVVA